ncbi:MAG: hypothetical protein IIV63_06425, partial [Clostridia bacterium]|nr:hypothetical protein [Clostridia bacterium]
SGSGSEADPYIIMNASQLAYYVSGNGTSSYVKLGADIIINENVLSEDYALNAGSFREWPVNSTTLSGTGVFDGDGHTIYGFYATANKAGLFYCIEGTVKNLTIADSYVGAFNATHGILGYKTNGGTIENVVVDGTAGGNHNGSEYGRGLMFGSGLGTFTNCITRGKVTAGVQNESAQKAGPFIGSASSGTSFTNCVNYADVDNLTQTGGFVGYTGGSLTFTDCINYGNISTRQKYNTWEGPTHQRHGSAAGGFVGVTYGGSITFTRCANEGTINGDAYSGGLVGAVLQRYAPTITIKNSYNLGAVSCQATNGVDYHGDFIGKLYSGSEVADENSGAGNFAIYQAGGWLGEEADLWVIKAGANPTLKLVAEEDTCEHVYVETSRIDATCTLAGQIVYVCDVCGGSYTEIIVAKGHNFVDDKCEVCGADPEAPHVHEYSSVTTDATCTTAGKIVYTCACGNSYFETIPAKGHTEVTETFDATCTVDGAIIVKCSVCGTVISSTVIKAPGHNYVDSECTVCGKVEESDYASGSGIESDPYIIMDATQLAAMRENLAAGVENDAYYKLGADIYLNKNVLSADYILNAGSFEAWPSNKATLTGVFDGDGHTIYGFYSKTSSSGLFYEIKGTVKNLSIKDSYVGHNNSNHGILGVSTSGGTFENVEVDGVAGGDHFGADWGRGLMFGRGNGTFINCVTRGVVGQSKQSISAQRCGSFIGSGSGTFINCANFAKVETFSQSGGFIGHATGATTFTDCINYGDVSTGTYHASWEGPTHQRHGSAAGGFVGVVWSADITFTRCANEGAIKGDAYTGGFIGVILQKNSPAITVNNSYNIGSVTTMGTNEVNYSDDFVGYVYAGTKTVDENSGAGELADYQAAEWLGAGADRWTCVVASNPYLTTIGGNGHVHSYTETHKDPTCTQVGADTYSCECGFSYSNEIPALGHSTTSKIVDKATCTKDGIVTYTCATCGYSYDETVEALGHKYLSGYCNICGEREIYTPDGAEWSISFVDANGNAIDTVSTANGEFWMVIRLTNYADFIGEMNSTGDLSTSTYDRTIATATTFVAMDNSQVIAVRENNKIVYSTPYDTATLTTNYDTTDGMLKAIFLSDENAGCTFSVGKSDLDANNGELFRIKVKSKLTEAGEISVKLVEESEYAASSVALVNKPEAGEWVNGTAYSTDLVFDSRCYDTIYKMNVTADEAPHEHDY